MSSSQILSFCNLLYFYCNVKNCSWEGFSFVAFRQGSSHCSVLPRNIGVLADFSHYKCQKLLLGRIFVRRLSTGFEPLFRFAKKYRCFSGFFPLQMSKTSPLLSVFLHLFRRGFQHFPRPTLPIPLCLSRFDSVLPLPYQLERYGTKIFL